MWEKAGKSGAKDRIERAEWIYNRYNALKKLCLKHYHVILVTAGSKSGQNHRFGTMPAGLMSARRHSVGAKDEAASAEADEFQTGWISGRVGFA
ncbi:MAG: hypothetical protein EHM37_00740 [Deltaproteobacteria bacterium]|nr:MAG: hypothetical protein EHM37_00740 [Deltaproteobacteria bacterium]